MKTICMPGSQPYTQWGCDMVDVQVFPDGEIAIAIPSNGVSGNDITLIGNCATAQASEAFLAAAYEIAAQGPKSFTVINTYFRNARSERADGKWAALAKFQARQWSGLGRVYPGVRLEFVDLHKDTVMFYFEGAVVTHNYAWRPRLESAVWLHSEGLATNRMVYATVDDGGVYEAKRLADNAKVGFAHIQKKRFSGSETKVLNVLGDRVKGRDVVIFDDMIATGGSMIKAAQAYKERGALRIIVAATHGVFAGDALDAMVNSGVIDKVFVTDSHPNARKAAKSHPKLIHLIDLKF